MWFLVIGAVVVGYLVASGKASALISSVSNPSLGKVTYGAAPSVSQPSVASMASGAALNYGEQSAINALGAIPVVGGALQSVAGSIVGIINAHHTAAVANEARILNGAVPAFMQTLQAILTAFTQGQINAAAASGYVDRIVVDYYTSVTGKGAGSIEGRWAATWPKPDGPWPPPNKPSTCNGPCVVGHYQIEGVATAAKRAMLLVESGGTESVATYPANYSIVNGAGMFTVDETPAHAGFQGFPFWSMSL